MSEQNCVNMQFSTPKRDSKPFNSIQLVATSPPIKDTLCPWNWSENLVKIELQGPSSSVCESPDVRNEGKRGRPRADDINTLIHEGAQSPSNIKCNICNRVFPREKSLQAHRRTHTGDRPYQCDYPGCTKAFTQSGQLKTHQRLHTGEKPFICSEEGCTSKFTHANRHCTEHPFGKLRRLKESEISLQLVTNECSEEVLRWLEKYQEERAERTPAKSRKNKRDEDETPNTPNDVYSPSSDSDIMSPPPIKRNKSRRGLGPLMEQHVRREQSVIFHNVSSRSDENQYISPYSRPDGNSIYISPAATNSPLRTRVLNIENTNTPTKSYRDFDMDGIRPLAENDDDRQASATKREFVLSTPLTTSSPVRYVKREPLAYGQEIRPYPSVVKRVYPQSAERYLPMEHTRVVKTENENRSSLASPRFSQNSPVSTVPRQPHVRHLEHTSPQIQTWYQDENIENHCEINIENKPKDEPETWRMALPKKKWIRNYHETSEPDVIPLSNARPTVLARTPLSNICQNRKIENQKLMGAVALIQLSNATTEDMQPLNLSTSKYSDT